MASNNSTILDRVWLAATNDFQQRVPRPSQGAIAATIDAILSPMNNDLYNQFCDILINRVGMVVVHDKQWQNPLSVFKKGTLSYGKTIQELAPMWIKAHAYQDDAETLLKVNRPDFAQVFHTVNREDRYDISINQDELRNAFTEEFGLNKLINSALTAQINSDNYDEFVIMKQLIAEYEDSWTFFKESLSAAPTDETTAKELVTKVKTYAGKLKFPSTVYNAGLYPELPVFESDTSKLVLLVSPEVNAVLDVEVLAYAFNMNKAEIPFRIVEVDEFPIPDCYALLTTEDFFVVYDYVYQTTGFYNPQTLTQNYYLHHWEVMSVSPLVPAILFTTDAGTTVPTLTQAISALTLTPNAEDISEGTSTDGIIAKGGDKVRLELALSGTLTRSDSGEVADVFSVQPESAVFEISAEDVTLNSRTYIDRDFVLHTQKTLESGDELEITAKCTYINPSGSTSLYTDSIVLAIGEEPEEEEEEPGEL